MILGVVITGSCNYFSRARELLEKSPGSLSLGELYIFLLIFKSLLLTPREIFFLSTKLLVDAGFVGAVNVNCFSSGHLCFI